MVIDRKAAANKDLSNIVGNITPGSENIGAS